MRKQDFLKKKAKQTGDPLMWQQYKLLRNSTNNEIKTAKTRYFTDNLEIKRKKSSNIQINQIKLSKYLLQQKYF